MVSLEQKDGTLNTINTFFKGTGIEFRHKKLYKSDAIIIESGLRGSVLACQVSQEEIARANSPEDLLIDTTTELFIRNVVRNEELIGKYPFTRIWADINLQKQKCNLSWNPSEEVPGWVHNYYRKRAVLRQMFPKENYNGGRLYVSEELKQINIPVPESNPEKEESLKAIRESIRVAKNTKGKKVVRRAPVKGLDLSKVKAPVCKDHDTEMIYDPVEMKWRCGIQGCNLVARPKRDSDDKTVIIGKGGIQLRLIFHEGERHVMMISDDNVALNVTDFVDIDSLMDRFDVETVAKEMEGKSEFTISVERVVPMAMRLNVMGADQIR